MDTLDSACAEIREEIAGLRADWRHELAEYRRERRCYFRVLFATINLGHLFLAGLAAKGFGWL